MGPLPAAGLLGTPRRRRGPGFQSRICTQELGASVTLFHVAQSEFPHVRKKLSVVLEKNFRAFTVFQARFQAGAPSLARARSPSLPPRSWRDWSQPLALRPSYPPCPAPGAPGAQSGAQKTFVQSPWHNAGPGERFLPCSSSLVDAQEANPWTRHRGTFVKPPGDTAEAVERGEDARVPRRSLTLHAFSGRARPPSLQRTEHVTALALPLPCPDTSKPPVYVGKGLISPNSLRLGPREAGAAASGSHAASLSSSGASPDWRRRYLQVSTWLGCHTR